MESGHSYCFGPFVLDPGRRLLLREEQEIPLYGKALDTLLLLVRNSDRLVKKDELLRELWANRVVEENNLSQSISAVRKALGDTTQPHAYVVTVPGWGYRFAAPVSMLADSQATGGANSSLDAPGTSSQPAVQKSAVQTPVVASSRSNRFAPATLVVVLILLSVFLFRSRFGSTIFAGSRMKAAPLANVRARRSVAIVGFQNLSGKKEDAWLSTALGEMLHTELGAGKQLRIISQEDVARTKAEIALANTDGRTKSATQAIAQSLGSDLLVSGSYSVIGEKSTKELRFDLRLQNAATGETIAEIAETGAQDELFGLVSQAGERLREKLGISELSPTETLSLRASLPKDTDAVRFYAQGLAKLRMFDTGGAKDLLQQAIAADPNYSLAHSALADAWSVLGYDYKSKEEAEKAFQLSGSLPRPDRLAVEGQYRMASKEWNQAIQIYKALFDLYPDDLDYGLHLASAQAAASATAEAFATLGSLRRLPPPSGNDPRIALKEYEVWKSRGDFNRMEQALAQAAQTSRQQERLLLLARVRSRQCWIQRVRAEQEQALAECREAQQIYTAAGDRRGQAEVLRFLGDLASSSDVDKAIGYYRQALGIEREIGHIGGQATVATMLATEYSSQGEHAKAKRSYEDALAIFQQLDEKTSVAGLTINVGGEYAALGQTAAAEKMYRQALESASAMDNKYLKAMAEYNSGLLQQVEGDLQGARHSYTEALTWFGQAGSHEYDIGLTKSLGELAMAEGNLSEARALYEKAMSMKQVSQQALSAAEAEMDLDELALEEGRYSPELESSLRRIVELFRKGNEISGNNALNDRALSSALLARYLLSEKRPEAAQAAVEEAVEMSATADPSVRLSVAVTAARIHFATGHSLKETKSVNELTHAIAQARTFHCFNVELEGRLALGEMEVKSGAMTGGRARLNAVEKDASRRGFLLLARKAKTVLRKNSAGRIEVTEKSRFGALN